MLATAKLGSGFGEDRFVAVGSLERWLVGGRPERPAGGITQVTERAPVVARAVLAPACDRDILPMAVAAARIGDHHVVAAIRQELHFGVEGVGCVEHAHRRFGTTGGGLRLGQFGRVQIGRNRLGDAFLEE